MEYPETKGNLYDLVPQFLTLTHPVETITICGYRKRLFVTL
jgi:hypothetical protein